MRRTWYRLAVALAATLVLLLAGVGPAQATVSVSRAELSGDRLRVEGSASPSRAITVDGVQMGTSGSDGSFRIERSGYAPPADCTVDVNDGSATATNVRLSGCTVATAPAPASLQSITLSPTTVEGGAGSTATVRLSAAAPSGGASVALSSSNTSVAAVPASVTVAAGTSSATATVTTSQVTTTTSATITATYAGVSRAATLTVTPPPPPPPPPGSTTLSSITLSPSTVQTGTLGTSATVSFSALTPAEGARVTLASSNTSVATVPAFVDVPASSSSGAFPVTIPSSAVGTSTISATYAGVTRSAVLTVTSQTQFRIITTSPMPTARVGQNYAGYIEACCGQGTPYRWSLVSGTVPDGLRFAGDSLRLSRTTAVTGVPTRVQTTTFTVRARDGAGNTATATFSLTVDPAPPLIINNQSDRLPDGTVGVFYETGLFPFGGVPPYRWSHVGGTLPPGLSVQASPGRVRGTPTTVGVFTFTVRVDDSGGNFATGQFTIEVKPAP